MEDRILTLHPEGKNGVRIERAKYSMIREAVLAVLAQEPCTFAQLARAVSDRLAGTFSGSIPWYTVTVKQDLLARGLIQEVPRTKPVQLVRTSAADL